jgi:hypothetical protein
MTPHDHDVHQPEPGGTLMRITRTLVAATVTLAATFTAVPAASADEVVCRGTLRAVTVDDVRVPDGARCRMIATTVEGTITLGDGATLRAVRVDVDGNIQGEDHRRAVIRRSSVGGSIQLVDGGSSVVARNDVGGDVQFFDNDGRIVIRRNVIDGNLQCKENDPAPRGGGNTIGGNAEDQCRKL